MPLQRLEELSLKGCAALAGPGLRHLAGLPNLQRLDLQACTRLTNKGARAAAAQFVPLPPRLRMHTKPQYQTALSPWSCNHWGKCETSVLCHCAGLEHVAQMKKLTHLNLRDCRLLTNDGLRRLAPATGLKSLALSNASGVTDKGLQCLAQLTGTARCRLRVLPSRARNIALECASAKPATRAGRQCAERTQLQRTVRL